ncbi:MAG: asparagine synthase (glutamine-hydrolyzing) [Planctomycetota bacterium]
MCGIAGIVRFDDQPIDSSRLRAMLAAVKHRGPDGEAISKHARCGLVHSRLSIIDLLSGQQPMHLPGVPGLPPVATGEDTVQSDHHGPLHLVFNGEIYNHRYLRKLLERRGHEFRSSHSDTEVLLIGYRVWGTQLPKHVHGMFAFAIYDEDKRELFLCRDRVGKKPLYTYRTRKEVRFGSLIPALVHGASPEEPAPEVDDEALLTYLRYGYVFDRPLLRGMSEVPPGHWLKIDAEGQEECQQFWRPPPISRHSTSLGAVDALEEVVMESVRYRLEADVELGCFLSGGIDSSVVAAFAQKARQERSESPIKAFTVSMPSAAFDERPYAEAVAKHLGTPLTVLETPAEAGFDDLDRLMAMVGEPTADSSLLPTYWLCRAAAEHVKVALSGDGGDELFGGYDRYRAIRMLQTRRAWVRAIPASLFDDRRPKSTSARLSRLVQAAKAGHHPAQHYHDMVHLFRDPTIARLAPGRFDDRLEDSPPVPDWPEEADHAHAAMRWDLMHYLPHELLRKVDRASMVVPLEVRCPLLGSAVLDLAGHLPASVLMPRNRPKGLLRQLAARVLPSSIVNRPKRGFAVPIGDWLRGPLRDGLEDRLFGTGAHLDRFGIDTRRVREMVEAHDANRADHTHRLFALVQLAGWSRWLQGCASASVGAR